MSRMKSAGSLVQLALNGLFSTKPRSARHLRKHRRIGTEQLEVRQLLTADFQMIEDINTTDNVARDIGESITFGNVLYFSAAADLTGHELWRSDGTDAGTWLVKDIAPGTADSSPRDFVIVGSHLYFTAANATFGRELWRTDGTTSGTVIMKNIRSGANGSDPRNRVNANGKLFFSADDGVNGRELWKSDGTASGTNMVKNLYTAAGGDGLASNSEIVAIGSTVYFAGFTSQTGTELYKSNGTSTGTSLVRDVDDTSQFFGPLSSSPTQLTRVSTLMYFVADSTDGTTNAGPTLFLSNGTFNGTRRLFRANFGDDITAVTAIGASVYFASGGSLYRTTTVNGFIVAATVRTGLGEITELTAFGNVVMFSLKTTTNRGQLWRTDGTSVGTFPISDFSTSSRVPQELHLWNSSLYFRVEREVWKSGGTPATTSKIADFNFGAAVHGATTAWLFLSGNDALVRSSGSAAGTAPVQAVETFGSTPSNLVGLGDNLYFTANDGIHGKELWRSESTFVSMVSDLMPDEASSNPAELTVFRNMLYFVATTSQGRSLWKTTRGTFGDETTLAHANLRGNFDPKSLTVVGDSLYFTATTSTAGRELWRISKTGDVSRVKDIRPGSSSSSPANLLAVGNQLYFTANDGINGTELWVSKGTSATTHLVVNLRSGSTGSDPKYLTEVNGKVFFQANQGTSGIELFKSDGTIAGTGLVRDIRTSGNSSPTELTKVGNWLYFTADDGASGRELWKSNGTTVGTFRVSDIAPGSPSSLPSQLTNLNGTLFFQATSSAGDTELWKSDGTHATTSIIRNINTSGSSIPISLTNIAGFLYFSASDGTRGHELWKSDGTSAGTVLLKNLEQGSRSSFPSSIVRVQNRVYVTADTEKFGREIYVDDLFDFTDASDSYTAEYIPSLDGNSVRIQKNLSRGPVTLATIPATEPINFKSSDGTDVFDIRGSSGNDVFSVQHGVAGLFGGSTVRMNNARFDIALMESVKLSGQSGNDTYRFTGSWTAAGAGENRFRIDESGTGIDTIDFSSLENAAKLNLGLTLEQGITNFLKLQLSSATSIDRIVGSAFGDELTGNSLANTIDGGDGSDTIDGGPGNDILRGGPGDDLYKFRAAPTAEGDQVTELPGEGIDTFSFAAITTPVTLSLGSTASQAVHSGRALILNAIDTFENATGGSNNDSLTGNGLTNRLTGGRGNDSLAGGPGDDVYTFDDAPTAEFDTVTEVASQGRDTLTFANVTSNVTLNLGLTTPQAVHTNRTLTLGSDTEFENAAGGSGNDVITGNTGHNVLLGNGGSDQLFGLVGRDILIGGTGGDLLNGADGEDILIAAITDFDEDFDALNVLMAAWTTSDSIGTRITNLRTGVGATSIALSAGITVTDDNGVLDELIGGEALDWFFRDLTDLITDLNGEVIDEL